MLETVTNVLMGHIIRGRCAAMCKLFSAFVVFVAIFTSGCGPKGPERAVVSGTVTHNGRPLEKGQIRFIPEKGSGVPMSGAVIVEGKYVADSLGGVPVAKHKIQIESWRINEEWLKKYGPPGPDALWEMIPKDQIIPEKYNVRTELEITLEPGSGEIIRNFELIN